MRQTASIARAAAVLTVLASVTVASGCSWFNGRGNGYTQNPRPLEIPPELVSSTPNTAGPVLASGQTTLQGFQSTGTRADVFKSLTAALAKVPGTVIKSSSELIGVQEIEYKGTALLVRVTESNGTSTVSVVDPRGQANNAPIISEFIAALKAAM